MEKIHKYTLRFFFDYGAGGCLWPNDELTHKKFGFGPIDQNLQNEKLISEARYWEIINLDNIHGEYLNKDYPTDPSLWTKENCAFFNSQVDELLKKLKGYLQSDFEIKDLQERYEVDPDLDIYLLDPKNFVRKK